MPKQKRSYARYSATPTHTAWLEHKKYRYLKKEAEWKNRKGGSAYNKRKREKAQALVGKFGISIRYPHNDYPVPQALANQVMRSLPPWRHSDGVRQTLSYLANAGEQKARAKKVGPIIMTPKSWSMLRDYALPEREREKYDDHQD